MNVLLIGYRGTGKTTVARLVAERLGLPWRDCDQEIERQSGKSIRELFAHEGEEGFRSWESQALHGLLECCGMVFALGGGVITQHANRELIRDHDARVFWLQADPNTIAERLAADPRTADTRPALTAAGGIEEIRQLLDRRTPLYRQLAHHEIETTGQTPEQVADQIVSLLKQPT